ncbi:glycosyltransferase [Natronolimnobius sp. AArcel1]|uniref:glycosyltransferase n=1 Tax=Natronolimnobius sp. AArcel1 TaxID=1679093 RepID=UPI0013EE0BB7|nr:glycosyltransferase [Natronolimnobius sp. AArcel1]NGM70317.1 glycosyltransferase [Natronolimnobius sp. AArcel1]
MDQLSVLVRTYKGDDPDALAASIQSLLEQTRLPDEIVVVEDGPLTATLEETLTTLERDTAVPIKRVRHADNQGNGAACRTGIKAASYELVAIQDADDLAVPRRLEWSLELLRATGADLVGGCIEEFETDPDRPHSRRSVPCDPAAIVQTAKLRNPINHTTVLARRQPILEVGNYRQLRLGEDYELWARLLAAGYTAVNSPRVLAKVRAGPQMYRRRGGLEHVYGEFDLQRRLASTGFVSRPRAAANFVVRSAPKLAPNAVRGKIITTLLRDPQPN